MSQAHSSFFDCLVPVLAGDTTHIGVTLRPDIAQQIERASAKYGKPDIVPLPPTQIEIFTCHAQSEPWLFFTDRSDMLRHVAREGKPEGPRL